MPAFIGFLLLLALSDLLHDVAQGRAIPLWRCVRCALRVPQRNERTEKVVGFVLLLDQLHQQSSDRQDGEGDEHSDDRKDQEEDLKNEISRSEDRIHRASMAGDKPASANHATQLQVAPLIRPTSTNGTPSWMACSARCSVSISDSKSASERHSRTP